jgi:hypothetical protein
MAIDIGSPQNLSNMTDSNLWLSGLYNWIISKESSDGINFLQSGGTYSRTVQDKLRDTFSVKDFGALGDGTTDDTAAFTAAIAAMVEGDCLVIPKGTFKITNVVFNAPDRCGILCFGKLQSAATGVAFTIGPSSGSEFRIGYNIKNLKVFSTTIDHTSGRVGIKIRNVYGSYIDLRHVFGFETGVLCYGDGYGVSYNEIHFGYIVDNKYSCKLSASATGWTNENCFHSGELTWSSAQDTDGWRHIWIDNCTNAVNNNKFFGCSLETVATTGDNSPLAIGVLCEGYENHFYGLRYEMDSGQVPIYFTANSIGNVVLYGFGLEDGFNGLKIGDDGSYNHVFTQNQVKISGNSTLHPVMRVHNGNGDTKAVIGVYDSIGTTLVWNVDGDGKTYVSGTQVVGARQSGVEAMTNVSAIGNLDADTVTTAQLADIVGNLITKLRAHGLVGD